MKSALPAFLTGSVVLAACNGGDENLNLQDKAGIRQFESMQTAAEMLCPSFLDPQNLTPNQRLQLGDVGVEACQVRKALLQVSEACSSPERSDIERILEEVNKVLGHEIRTFCTTTNEAALRKSAV